MFDTLMFVLLVVNATGLFRFVAPLTGLAMAQVSCLLMCLQCICLVARRRHVVCLLRRIDIKWWSILLLAWPVITAFYSPVFAPREVGVQLYYWTLFLCGAVYCRSRGLNGVRAVLGASLLLSAVGLVLSMAYPAMFQDIAAMANARSFVGGRAFGFELQANGAAVNLVILFLGWHASRLRKTAAEPAMVLFLIVVLLTGSRLGALLAALLCVLTVAPAWLAGISATIRRRQLPARTMECLCVAVLCVCGISGLATSGILEEHLSERIALLLRGRLADGHVVEDGSLKVRLEAQAEYRSWIQASPWLGHGLGADAHYRELGIIRRASHSSAHTIAMQCGILYPAAFCVLLLRMYRHRNRRRVERALGTNVIVQFTVVTALTFFVSGGLDGSRAFYVVLGMAIGMLYSPSEALGRHAECLQRMREMPQASRSVFGNWQSAKYLRPSLHNS